MINDRTIQFGAELDAALEAKYPNGVPDQVRLEIAHALIQRVTRPIKLAGIDYANITEIIVFMDRQMSTRADLIGHVNENQIRFAARQLMQVGVFDFIVASHAVPTLQMHAAVQKEVPKKRGLIAVLLSAIRFKGGG